MNRVIKVETIIEEYKHCGECVNAVDYKDRGRTIYHCDKTGKLLFRSKLWGEIPKWCPLPFKEIE